MAKHHLLVPLLLCACSAKSETQPSPPKVAAPAAVQAAALPVPTTPPEAGGLTWRAQAPLVRRAPRNGLRAAEYGLEGDAQAELSVTYFGNARDSAIQATVARWLQQFGQLDAGDTGRTKRGERKAGELTISLIETTGRYSEVPATPAIEDAMLLGAVAHGPKGAVFFKLVAKRSSMSSARPAFDALLASLQPAS